MQPDRMHFGSAGTWFTACALCLAATGCSYQYRVDAAIRDGKVVFTAEAEGLLGSQPCAETFELVVRNALGTMPMYRTVWKVENGRANGGACADFPIVYGETPAGLRQTVAPEPLRPGVAYEIMGGGDGADAFGSFRIAVKTVPVIERVD